MDATGVLAGDTGVARYIDMLWRHLHDQVEIRAFGIGRGRRPSIPLRRVPVPLRLVHRSWARLGYPTAEAIVGAVDVVHSTDMVPPPTRRPLVMTVHDALPLVMPELYGPRFRAISAVQLTAARAANVVLTHCHATAADLVDVACVPAENVLVTPPGWGAGDLEPRKRPIAEPYILAVGAVTPRKAFHHLAEAAAMLGEACPLIVIAGPDGWRSEVVHKRVRELQVRARFLGRVDEPTLEALYQHAVLLCHPSIGEGFGLPCLEAMARGLPVVAADIPPVRELGSGCFTLVPPSAPAELAAALEAVLAGLDRQSERASAGRVRASAYTWKAAAAATVTGYERALAHSA